MSILINGKIKVEPTIFPDKTSQVWRLPLEQIEKAPVTVTWDFENEAEFVHLAQLRLLLKEYGYDRVTLVIKYLPYARQDKPISNETTFALRAFLPLLACVRFDAICIHDPHSDVATEILGHLGITPLIHCPTDVVDKVIKDCAIDLLCFPDEGALKRYSRLYPGLKHIYGVKVRDQLTGRIENYDLEAGPQDIRGKNVLIVDDLCDAGGTFILLAKELRLREASKVSLFVSHGLFTKGTEVLFESGISRVFTKEGEVRR